MKTTYIPCRLLNSEYCGLFQKTSLECYGPVTQTPVHGVSLVAKCSTSKMLAFIFTTGGSRGGARGARAPPLFWVKKEEITEGKMAAMASKSRPGPPLSSRSGSATVHSTMYTTQETTNSSVLSKTGSSK